MTFASVTDALHRYEERLDRIGFRTDFADGLTPAQLAEIETEAGFRLSEDVHAVWSWRGGTSVPSGQPTTAASMIVPGGIFPNLPRALWWGKAIANAGAEMEQYPFDVKHFAALCVPANSPFIIDSTDPDLPDSPTLRGLWGEGVFIVPPISVTERINLWIEMVDIGAWYVDDTGRLMSHEHLLTDEQHLLLGL